MLNPLATHGSFWNKIAVSYCAMRVTLNKLSIENELRHDIQGGMCDQQSLRCNLTKTCRIFGTFTESLYKYMGILP